MSDSAHRLCCAFAPLTIRLVRKPLSDRKTPQNEGAKGTYILTFFDLSAVCEISTQLLNPARFFLDINFSNISVTPRGSGIFMI